ncbi:MAG: FkbM family methyltransferase [Hyphomicrobiales bacterium]|nr:MAG: FkbM family methyltransferase [Hyphomicrobiales bacterium]
MTQILNGEIIYNENSVNANGGTELMARRMAKDINPDLLKEWQIIHSRIPNKLEDDKKIMLVCHDLARDPMYQGLYDEEYIEKFDLFVFVSNWQKDNFLQTYKIPYNKCAVVPNYIEPFPTRSNFYDGGIIKLIYHTTPHRGLELLIPAFQAIEKQIPNIELDVYSSFKAYGWESRDEQYRTLIEVCEDHEKINYHGFQSNDVVREALMKSHIFAYPNIWPETSCLALIEAIASGNIVVAPNHAAIPETAQNLATLYQFNDNKQEHFEVFAQNLFDVVGYVNSPEMRDYLDVEVRHKQIHMDGFTTEFIVQRWEKLLKAHL